MAKKNINTKFEIAQLKRQAVSQIMEDVAERSMQIKKRLEKVKGPALEQFEYRAMKEEYQTLIALWSQIQRFKMKIK